MVKKLVVLTAFFVALCFAGVGCFTGGGLYYDGPYRNGSVLLYYLDGGLYVYQGGDFRFDHYVPQDLRGNYEEQHRKNREQYNRDYPNWRDQHREHPWASRRYEDRKQ
jgi:hypothetical protein